MITGDPGVETATDSIRLGAFDYIPKPVNQESLLGLTRTALKYKALHEEKERYRTNLEAIFRSVRDAIITVDKESVLIELNEAAMTLCAYSRDDIGKPFGLSQDAGEDAARFSRRRSPAASRWRRTISNVIRGTGPPGCQRTDLSPP
jgi:PAS domain S-box-containing protein